MAVESTTSAGSLQMSYMKLLIAELQNQNPLDPMSNTEMTGQMTQLSQLEQLEKMNTSFSSVLKNTELNYANSLIGKQVVYTDSDGDYTSGLVTAVGITDDDIQLQAGEEKISLADVLAIGQ